MRGGSPIGATQALLSIRRPRRFHDGSVFGRGLNRTRPAVTRTGRYLSSDSCWCFRSWVSVSDREPVIYAGTGVFAALAASFAIVFLSGS